ncbi:hypothetical protein [Alicyclobacillus acidiphilus]|uniref:hypothetical protein n=1 Tax=Alicyclobacillus acidiphilus TaxID=182455 RepID=UPI0008330FD8|nr:hypothetical protein [Alicyclobacillus acidiphilus]
MQERLRIHHGIGSRVLLDSARDGVSYEWSPDGSGHVFHVHIEPGPILDEILRLRRELNVFLFRDDENGATIEKQWFYTGDREPWYDSDTGTLTLVSSRTLTYHPGDFES